MIEIEVYKDAIIQLLKYERVEKFYKRLTLS